MRHRPEKGAARQDHGHNRPGHRTVFQLHAEDASGRVLDRKRLTRDGLVKILRATPPALIAMEACGSAHDRGRTPRAFGHDVRLIPAAYAKPFV